MKKTRSDRNARSLQGSFAARGLFIISFLALCWLLMQAVHELGHVLHARWSGGVVQRVVLHPAAISRTDVAPNPHPWFVAWGGPVWGVMLPLVLWAGLAGMRYRHAFLARFFAGFCLVANGAYIGVGAVMRIGDADDLLRHGASSALLIGFGIFGVAAGLLLWNGLAPKFGIGPHAESVSWWVALAVATALAVTICVELMLSIR